jgi:DNA-binding transcriptional LysR family regulator
VTRNDIGDLIAFLAVAKTGSFTQASRQLGVSQPALSQTLRELERRLGLRLLNRTTRSVSTTEAGERLRRSIGDHFDAIESGLADLKELRDKPAGTIRITTGDHQAEAILLPAAARLLEAHPDLKIEISVNLGFVDIVADRFDAGVRMGETVAQDMVAMRIGPDLRMAVVGSPTYFANRPKPATPHDLAAHNCINMRFTPEGGMSLWEFEKQGRPVNVRVDGQLTVNNITLERLGALQGAGLAYLPEAYVAPMIDSGALVSVLDDWCEPFPGYHLYYPSRRQHTAGFVALLDVLRYRE